MFHAPHAATLIESIMTSVLVCVCVVLGVFSALFWSLVLVVRRHVGGNPMHSLEEDV